MVGIKAKMDAQSINKNFNYFFLFQFEKPLAGLRLSSRRLGREQGSARL
jgi:hypothetical protein